MDTVCETCGDIHVNIIKKYENYIIQDLEFEKKVAIL